MIFLTTDTLKPGQKLSEAWIKDPLLLGSGQAVCYQAGNGLTIQVSPRARYLEINRPEWKIPLCIKLRRNPYVDPDSPFNGDYCPRLGGPSRVLAYKRMA